MPALKLPEQPIQQQLQVPDGLIEQVCQGVLQSWQHQPELFNKSHQFMGRYENLYLEAQQCPGLETLIGCIKQQALSFLSPAIEPSRLAFLFWFNLMGQGQQTTWHNHDELDEQLSGVVYLQAAPGSAAFLYRLHDQVQRIQPATGAVLWFNPALDHAVEIHNIETTRLALAFNFGLLEQD